MDVFFVISGYLITQLMLREAEYGGRVKLVDFWARRIRRILPAGTLVLCATVLLAATLTSSDMRLLGRHVVAASLFYYNWRQAAAAVDYLAQADADNPLMHYWSLSLEEQFYMIWPLLFASVAYALHGASRRRRGLVGLAAALMGASFAYSLYLTHANAALAFFSTFGRSWQLLAGSLAALLVAEAGRRPRPPMDVVTGLAAAALAGSFLLIGKSVPYPGLAASVPTIATAALLYCGAVARTRVSTALSVGPAQFIGRVSYSWYLWHWPMLVLLGPAVLRGRVDTPAITALAIVLSFLLATLTYTYVERPIRNSAKLKSSLPATYALGAILILSGVSVGAWMKYFGPDSISIGDGRWISRAAAQSDLPVIYADRCLLHFEDIAQPDCRYGSASGARTVVLLGDSHAANWFVPLNAAAAKLGWRLLVRTKASCRPLNAPAYHDNGARYDECEQWRRAALREIERIAPDVVIVASAEAKSVESERPIFDRIAAASRRLIVMRDTPRLGEMPINCLARTSDPSRCTWRLRDGLPNPPFPLSRPPDMPANASIVDLNRLICRDDVCRAITDGALTMADNQHLTASYALSLASEFERLLAQIGTNP